MNKIHKLGRTRSNPFGMPLLAILIFLGTCQSMWAQVATGYTFASTPGTYVPITGTILAPTTGTFDDEVINAASTPALPGIGFTFNYNGIPYTTCSLSVNGWIFFGATPLGGLPISSTTAGPGGISAFGKDLVQRTVSPLSELRVDLVGTAPNREYVIQFSNWGLYTGASLNLDVYNFQIRLQENGSKIVFSYGNMTVTSATAADAPVQVGLRGFSNADFNNRAVAAGGSWAASTAGTTNAANATLTSTIVPPSGLTYTWTPVPCTGVPATSTTLTNLALVSSQPLAVSGRAFTLSVSASNIGNTFQWQSSPTLTGTYTNVPSNGNGPTYTTTQTVATAYRCIISCGVATPVPTPTTSAPVLVGIDQVVNSYCLPVVVANVACITNVTLGNINNTTTCASNVNHVATNTGVTNFPSNITTSLALGASVPIIVSTSSSASVGVWVDFNANGLYETTEFFQPYTTGTTGTVNIVVPAAVGANCVLGLTKMRVRSRFGATVITNANACSNFATAGTSGEVEDYWININPAGCTSVVVSATTSPLNLTKGVAMASITPSATGGAGGATYTYALTAGTLPVGVTFVGGVISGTPTTLESGTFTITATSTPGSCTGSLVYRFNVNNTCTAVTLSATPAAVAGKYDFIISKPVSIEFASTGGLATTSGYAYSITAGALPSGLLLNTSTGIIAGTPNTVGTGTFSVTSRSIAENCSVTVVYTYATVCPTVALSPVAGALVYKWNNDAPSISASGGANYTFSVSAGALPTGLTLTSTGAFTGQPTVLGQTGTFTVSVNTTTAALPTACTAVTAVYTFTVACSSIDVAPVIPNIIFTKGLPIQDIILSASEIGSTPLYNFAVTGLPAGVTFVTIPATTTPVAPAIYKIAGTPTTAGTGLFVITATNPNAVALTCTGTSTTAFTVIDNPTTSLDALSSLVKVSPNPSKGEFNVDFSGIALGKATVRVYDAQGKQVYTSNVSNNQMTISLENLSSGIYLMEVDSAKGRILKRLAKQ